MVQFFERGLVEFSIALIGDDEVFAGMHVVKRERARVAVGDHAFQRLGAEKEQKRG